jgi:two-component system, LytTR family, sensor kinase
MKEFLNKFSNFSRVEFWAATTIYVFIIFFYIADSLDAGSEMDRVSNKIWFDKTGIPFYYFQDYFIPKIVKTTFLYAGFLIINLIVVPGFFRRQAIIKNVFVLLLVFTACGLAFGITDTYYKNYLFLNYETEQEAYAMFFRQSFLLSIWLIFVIGFYNAIKFGGVYLLQNSEQIQARYSMITKDVITAFIVWLMSMFLIMLTDPYAEILVAWGVFVPASILFYGYNITFSIRQVLGRKRPLFNYMVRSILIQALAYVPVAALVILLTDDEDAGLGFSLLNAGFQILITAPLAWVIFRKQMKGNEELVGLKRELGQTHANFDFLRSQINPHFLFNALNTIYGTAIQEKAERTSEAVERLGDMMRFMLHENMQEKISLLREIEYLHNYISLQKLRTDSTPTVQIQTDIQEPEAYVQIAPMLLIPFVENAFKHGISLRNPSHVKVLLEVKDNVLQFDVYNSKHLKLDNDPEKNKSGIGLVNVKQRLKLMYPGKHELIIRETTKEFFIHLTINLS